MTHVHSDTAVALVDGRSLLLSELEGRLWRLESGRRATMLPAAGTPEHRQLRRWIAQVMITEALCAGFADESAIEPHVESDEPAKEPAKEPDEEIELDRAGAIELGSIVAAAYAGDRGVRAAYRALTADVTAPVIPAQRRPVDKSAEPRYRVRHGVVNEYAVAMRMRRHPDTLARMGWVCPADLPASLAHQLRQAGPGDVIGPVWSALGYSVLVVEDIDTETPPPEINTVDRARESERRRVFLDWLAVQRRDRWQVVDGYEHPGDPRQPDNHHRH